LTLHKWHKLVINDGNHTVFIENMY